VPELVGLVEQMRAHTASRSPLAPKFRELIILVTAREWTQPFEWHIHYPGALKNGLTLETVTAIAEGRRPPNMPEDEQIVYDMSMELHHNKSVSDATYARALAAFGEPGIVEIAAVNGFYSLLAMVMNTVRMNVPPSPSPKLERFPK
jgi:4-carboxymuconolactone decarboxylase